MHTEIRPARPDEADFLSALALRSKATWGYSAAFMQRCEPLLRVTSAYIDQHPVYVAVVKEVVIGFYSLNTVRYAIELDLLFVDTGALGQGIGQALLKHACAHALALGYSEMFVESDPGAEAFYARLGGVRIGTVTSTVEVGRVLPLLRFQLPLDSISQDRTAGAHALHQQLKH